MAAKKAYPKSKFLHRPYKPKKLKPKPKRTADEILAAARKELKRIKEKPKFSYRPYRQKERKAASIRNGPRSTQKETLQQSSADVAPPADPADQWFTINSKTKHSSASHRKRSPSRYIELMKDTAGNPPAIGTGHGRVRPEPEIWFNEDYYVILEAKPDCFHGRTPEQIKLGFALSYVMTATCFYRLGSNPHMPPKNLPLFIYTLETSTALPHRRPGILGMMLGEKPEPLEMVVGRFSHMCRSFIDRIEYDGDFTTNARLLLNLCRKETGNSGLFCFAGNYTRDMHLLAAMQ